MKGNFTSISDILKVIIVKYGLQEKFREYQVLEAWQRIAGKSVNNHTFAYLYKNKILFVKVDSNVWIQQLIMLKSNFIKKINKKLNRELVKEIKFKLADKEEVRSKKWQKT